MHGGMVRCGGFGRLRDEAGLMDPGSFVTGILVGFIACALCVVGLCLWLGSGRSGIYGSWE
jgi:hypothetical protein